MLIFGEIFSVLNLKYSIWEA